MVECVAPACEIGRRRVRGDATRSLPRVISQRLLPRELPLEGSREGTLFAAGRSKETDTVQLGGLSRLTMITFH
jgi:hypothetical protein